MSSARCSAVRLSNPVPIGKPASIINKMPRCSCPKRATSRQRLTQRIFNPRLFRRDRLRIRLQPLGQFVRRHNFRHKLFYPAPLSPIRSANKFKLSLRVISEFAATSSGISNADGGELVGNDEV